MGMESKIALARIIPRGEWKATVRGLHEAAQKPLPWYTRLLGVWPRATADRANRVVYVREGAQYDEDLMAHEFGHLLGIEHTAWWSFDVMSPYPLRFVDIYGLRRRARTWIRDSRGGRS